MLCEAVHPNDDNANLVMFLLMFIMFAKLTILVEHFPISPKCKEQLWLMAVQLILQLFSHLVSIRHIAINFWLNDGARRKSHYKVIHPDEDMLHESLFYSELYTIILNSCWP